MSDSEFNASAQVTATRTALGKRLGEIIEAIIGDGRVRELFDKAGKHPDEYAGKPTGLMALDLKVITPDTKTALLVAQAAERAHALAEKAAAIAAGHDAAVQSGTKADAAGIVKYDDPVFKFVGSDRDPPLLQRAQGVWMAAQMLLNSEITSVNANIENALYIGNPKSQGADAAEGFKKTAAELYAEAAQIMSDQGHGEAAAKFTAVSQALAQTAKDGPAPSTVMTDLAADFAAGSAILAQIKKNPAYLAPMPIEEVYAKLATLSAKPGEEGPSAAAAPAPVQS